MVSSYAVLERPPAPQEAYYAPRGGAHTLWFAKDREILIEGPSGCIAGEVRLYEADRDTHYELHLDVETDEECLIFRPQDVIYKFRTDVLRHRQNSLLAS